VRNALQTLKQILMTETDTCAIIEKQMEFYKKSKAGCMFVAIAAKESQKYEWKQTVISSINANEIDKVIQNFVESSNVSTLSIIFPTVNDMDSLLFLLQELENCQLVVTEKQFHDHYLCYAFRVKVREKLSWVTGFGPFDFFPKTRKTPFSEITFRIKDRPDYDWVMKESPKNILHLADMDMKGIPKEQFSNLWNASLANTEKILGHKPDFISAAKTSFSIPLNLTDNEN
jgi:hypothetical protein